MVPSCTPGDDVRALPNASSTILLCGGLNNMLMQVAHFIGMDCFDESNLWLNSGHDLLTHNGRIKLVTARLQRRHLMAPHRFNDIFTLSTPFRPSTTCTHRDQSRISPQWYRDPSHLAGLRALYARLRIAPRLERYVARALDAASSQTVVHLRLEQDWVNIANMCARTDAKRCWSPEDVAQKVNDTSAKVIIAADNTERDVLRSIRRLFGGGIVPAHANLSYTENAAVHMMVAVRAQTFWGNSFSTLSRGVAQIRALHGRTSFAYDCGPRELQSKQPNSGHLRSAGMQAFAVVGPCPGDGAWVAHAHSWPPRPPARRGKPDMRGKPDTKCPADVDMNKLEALWPEEHFRGPLSGPQSYFRRVPPHYLGNLVDFSKCRRRVYIDVGARTFSEGLLEMLRIYPSLVHFDAFFAIEAVAGFYKLPPERQLRRLLTKAGMPPARAADFQKRHFFLQAFVGAQSDPSTSPPTIGFSDLLRHALGLQPADAVVVKMDVEGYEYAVIDTMLRDGTQTLVDELMLEVHYSHPRMAQLFHWCTARQRGYNAATSPFWCNYTLGNATQLYQGLRTAGVYTHHWP